MSQLMEEIREEARVQERLREKRNTVMRLYQRNLALSEISLGVDISEEQAKAWLEEAGLMK